LIKLKEKLRHNPAPKEGEIREQVDRIVSSPIFLPSRRLIDFLQHVTNKTLAGESSEIKQFTIGVIVYNQNADFDPKTNPLVRIEARRLRRVLQKYYDSDGKNDRIFIEIPRGHYVPIFSYLDQKGKSSSPADDIKAQPRRNIEPPVVAVFPFRYDGDDQHEYLPDGLAEALTFGFSQFPEFRTMAYNTTAQFKNSLNKLQENAASLGIDFALSGVLRIIGDSLRVRVQLLDVLTGEQLWLYQHNDLLTPDNILKIKDSILKNVLGQVADNNGIILRHLSKHIGRQSTTPSTFEAILRGYHYQLCLSLEAFRETRVTLETATQTEPDVATTWAMLSQLYLDAEVFGYEEIPDAIELGIEYASRAVAIDPGNQLAHHARAYAGLIEQDREAIIYSADQMLSCNPNSAAMVATAGFWLCLAGKYEKGMEWFGKGIELNPLYPGWLHAAPFFYYLDQQDFEKALQQANAFGMPDFFWGPMMRASVLGLAGRIDEAIKSYASLLELKPDFPQNSQKYIKFFALGDNLVDTINQGLKKAGLTPAPVQ
jgi:TolB-like protein